MSKVKSITTQYEDGTSFTSHPEVPYDAANPDCRKEGIQVGSHIYFPDGSYKEASGICHQPPRDPQFPKEVWKNILTYHTAKSNILSKEFDKLRERMLDRESTFEITLPGEIKIDALLRLERLAAAIVESEEKKGEANKHLGRVEPKDVAPVYTKEELSEYEVEEKKRKQFFDAVDRIQKPEIKEDLRLTGTR